MDANGFLFRNPPPSLRALCASGPRVEVRGVLHEVLGEHTQKIASFSADDASAGGARDSAANAAHRANDDAFETNEDETRGRVGAYLFRRHVPRERLDVEACARATRGVWREKIVVSASPLPPAMVAAILDAEAKVVVAPDAEAAAAEGATRTSDANAQGDARLAGFFAAFYHALYVVGADAVAALGAAALVHPECARFRCHMRVDGKTVALKAGDDDLLPEE